MHLGLAVAHANSVAALCSLASPSAHRDITSTRFDAHVIRRARLLGEAVAAAGLAKEALAHAILRASGG